MKRKISGIVLVIFALGLGLPRASAQDEPTPGAARISVIHGDVSTMRGDTGDWVATTANAPLVRGDKIATGARSRAEIQLDYANVLRLDQNTEVQIADLTRTRIQIQVASGLADFSVFKGTEADVEVDTPNMAVHPLGEGTYRIEVDSTAETSMTVRRGQAEVSTPQGSTTVEKDQVINVKGTDNPEFRTDRAAGKDEWDQWNRDRDSAIADAKSWNHTNRYYTGTEDLDRYGHWVNVPNYDWCWTPYVNAGWVPYRDGSWEWEPYWGWTWVSYEPWGWAPYHYGRWFWGGSSWCWWPGYSYWGTYPTWAPAYVSFLGFGFGGRNWSFGFGFGFNSIGWCPLGPYDHARPWWGRGNSFNVVNITNITNVNGYGGLNNRQFVRGPGRDYVSNLQAAMSNVNVRRAITTVPTNQFVTGRVPRNTGVMDPAVLRTAGVIHGTLPAVPTREALGPMNRAAQVPAVAQGTRGERFFTRNPAPQMSFNQRAAQIQQMMQTHNPMAAGNAQAGQTNANRAGAENLARPGQAGAGNANRAFTGGAQGAARVESPQAAPVERGVAPRSQQAQPGGDRFQRQAPNSYRDSGRSNAPALRSESGGGRSYSAPRGGGGGGGGHSSSPSRGGGGGGGSHRR